MNYKNDSNDHTKTESEPRPLPQKNNTLDKFHDIHDIVKDQIVSHTKRKKTKDGQGPV